MSAEQRCCPFLDLTLREEGDALVLAIGAEPETQPVATMLAEAFEPSDRRPEGAGGGA